MKKPDNTLFFSKGNPEFEGSDAAILGVAWDANASYGKGAALAPKAILEASWQMDIEDPLTGKTLQAGIHSFGVINPKTTQGMIGKTAEFAAKALDAGKFFILLGGDHSVVNGLLDALPKETHFVNFDAHLDLREQWLGKKQSHAAVSRRVFDKGFEQSWVGVRDLVNEEEMAFVAEQGLAESVFYCPARPKAYYEGKKFPGWMKRENLVWNGKMEQGQVEAILSRTQKKVWLNIDIDCLDLREGIETGVPTPFGLSLEGLRDSIFEICRKKQVLGFNLCEVVPDSFNRGQSASALLCYQIIRQCLG